MVRQVQPLRIQKGTHGTSPAKMASATNRPLAEVSPMAIRRNSPSFPQGTKVRQKSMLTCNVMRYADMNVAQHVQERRIVSI
jgi:hypothetical protein